VGWTVGVQLSTRAMTGIFIFTTVFRTTLGPTETPLHLVLEAIITLGVKRLGREADHSPPSSAEVKNTSNCTFIHPIRLHGVVLN